MKTPKIVASVSECEAFDQARNLLKQAQLALDRGRSELVMAGVGTFWTVAEHKFLLKLDARLNKLNSTLKKKSEAAWVSPKPVKRYTPTSTCSE